MKKMMSRMNMKKNNKGFTLVELIIVIAIIAVLTAVLAPQYVKYVERSRQGVDASTLEEVRHAVEVEAGITDNLAEGTFTVTITNGTGAIAGGTGTNIDLKNVTDVVGNSVKMKSSAVNTATFTIDVADTGAVTWDTDSQTAITALQGGSAEADKMPGYKAD